MQCPHHPFNQKNDWWLSYITGFLQGSLKKWALKENLPNLKGIHPGPATVLCVPNPATGTPASSARLPGVFVAPSGRIGRSWAGFSVRQKLAGLRNFVGRKNVETHLTETWEPFGGDFFVVRKSLGNILGFFFQGLDSTFLSEVMKSEKNSTWNWRNYGGETYLPWITRLQNLRLALLEESKDLNFDWKSYLIQYPKLVRGEWRILNHEPLMCQCSKQVEGYDKKGSLTWFFRLFNHLNQ